MKITVNKNQIMKICEAGRLAIMAEEIRRWENDMEPLSNFYREIIYQKYKDMAVDMFRTAEWEEVGDLYDKWYKENEENHRYDGLAYT